MLLAGLDVLQGLNQNLLALYQNIYFQFSAGRQNDCLIPMGWVLPGILLYKPLE
jgi:hypothetical protein